MSRVCKFCSVGKPLEAFEPAKRYRGGRMPVCRECRKGYRSALHSRPKTLAGTKVCAACRDVKLTTLFAKDQRSPDGFTPRCRACRAVVRAKEDPRKTRERFYRWKFGISVGDYEQLFLAQNRRCKICRATPEERGARQHLDVDHDHVSGTIRGLLCSPCNTAIGLLADDPERARAVARYLEEGMK